MLTTNHRYSPVRQFLLGLLGFAIFLGVWWGLAEVLSENRAIIEYDTRPASAITMDSASLAARDSLLAADEERLANATEFEKVYPLLPPPLAVIGALPGLFTADPGSPATALLPNTVVSVWRNLQGYFWAVFLSLLIGIPIGLIPPLRAMFSRQIDTLRYVPITALIPLFIIAFGLGEALKVSFLAFGILVYLLPVVVQRLDETADVYLKTAFTLGATDWQLVRSVYLPSVFAKIIDDIRVLTAISWTYIIIAESLNRDEGLGGLIYIFARQGRLPSVYAVLIIIVLIGFAQDRLFVYLDRRLFPHKYLPQVMPGLKETRFSILTILGVVMAFLLLALALPGAAPVLGYATAFTVVASILMLVMGEVKLQAHRRKVG